MKSTLSPLSRRTFGMAALAVAATPLLSACGGGDTSSAAYNDRTPGTVPLTVTHKVTMTISMPDLTGVTNPATLDKAGYDALPLVSKTVMLGLDRTHAPISVDNFLAYLKSGAYVNTIFHRVVSGFVVQGGGYTDSGGTLTHITTSAAIALESRNGLSNTRGTLAMARTEDANSATSEFFVNLVNNATRLELDDSGNIVQVAYLDYGSADSPGYAVFGTVLDADSMAVIDTIAKIAVDSSSLPLRDVTVTAISVVSLI